MSRILRTGVLATAMIGLGSVAGRAQTSQPAFELLITSPIGDVTVECVKGCALVGKMGEPNPAMVPAPQPKIGYACNQRCSVPVDGWTK